jgi:hypothetical protein
MTYAATDAEFNARIAEHNRKEDRGNGKVISKDTGALEYGLSDNELAQLWHNSILRSAAAQRVLADAARYRLAKRSASKPAARPIPPVQKPGNAMPVAKATPRLRELDSKSSLSVKEAAELLALKAGRRSESRRA